MSAFNNAFFILSGVCTWCAGTRPGPFLCWPKEIGERKGHYFAVGAFFMYTTLYLNHVLINWKSCQEIMQFQLLAKYNSNYPGIQPGPKQCSVRPISVTDDYDGTPNRENNARTARRSQVLRPPGQEKTLSFSTFFEPTKKVDWVWWQPTRQYYKNMKNKNSVR